MKRNKKLLMTLMLSVMALTSCGSGSTASSVNSAKPSTTSKTSRPSHSVAEVEKVAVTYDLNYEGAPAAKVVEYERNEFTNLAKAVNPEEPTRAGYSFMGWMESKTATTMYNFNKNIEGKTLTLYAKWSAQGVKKFVAEAEFCPCITDGQGMTGSTYSGGTNGKGLIQEDYENAAQSENGYFVHFLYTKGNTLTFELVSDVAVENATIYMRLSAEYRETFTINKDKYPIKVNGVSIDYGDITFTDVPAQGAGWYAFGEFLLSDHISLNAGTNTIEMITNNNEKMYGTAESTAPMVDNIKVYSTSNITWPTAKLDNIESDSE